MKTTLLLTVLLLLPGCGDVEHLTEPQSQIQEISSVTRPVEPSIEPTEPPAVAVPGQFTGKVIRVVDGATTAEC